MRQSHAIAGAAGLACAMLLGAAMAAAAADLQKREFKVIGSWGNLSNYQKHEQPFWNDVLPAKSNGAVTGKINAITDLGLKGFEVMRLVKLGVFDVAFGVFGYVASEHPVFEGVDLAAAAKDFAEARANADAYRPVLEEAFETHFDAKMLVIYPYPSQLMFCNKPIASLDDMKGKKIRVYSTTLGDLVEGLGGVSVTVAFAEVVPAMQKGVVDCGITGTMPAYQAKWYEVASHVLKIRVGAGLAFMAVSLKTWNELDKATQDFLLAESAALEDRMWTETQAEDEMGISCNTGGQCSEGVAGKMQLIEPSEADYKTRARILKDFVLKRWAKRCGADCAKEWNATIGNNIDIMAASE